MEGKSFSLLIVSLIFICEGVFCDPFAEVANDLKQRDANIVHSQKELKNIDKNIVYKENQQAYIEKFKHFLQNFDNSNRAISEVFENEDEYAWAGHYILRANLDTNLRDQLSLKGTPFQNVHSDIIDRKNRWVVRKFKGELTSWSKSMLVETQAVPQTDMEKIRITFTAALLAMDDMASADREFEVFSIFFDQILKRMTSTKNVHQDSYIKESFHKFVNKYFRRIGCKESDSVPKCCILQSSAINGYTLKQSEQIKQLMSQSIDANYKEISKELLDLYFTIFESAPIDYNTTKIINRFNSYNTIYARRMGQDEDFRIIQMAHNLLSLVYSEQPKNTFKRLTTFTSMKTSNRAKH